jgi:hypothetical protein
MKTPQLIGNQKIFAYLRRSTKKEEQKESKKKQNDSIDLMANDIWIPLEEIQIFEDDFTGYKIKTKDGKPQTKRKGYMELMKEIDKCKTPCILLAYDYSRLARNAPDGITVCEKLGLYGNEQKIEYIRFYDGTIWDKTTREKVINDAFSEANGYSDALSKQKQDKNITSLRRSIMPKTIKAPHGLKATDRGLEVTDKMPFIAKAFEMKSQWETAKEICKYLAINGIKIKEGNLTESVFQKTVYIGEYTHPKTGDFFDKLIFTGGKSAISRQLWDKVQARLWKKGGGYGEKQQGDIIAQLLKIRNEKGEEIGTMSGYTPKDKKTGKLKTRQYKSSLYEKFNIAEMRILEEFMQTTDRMCFIWFKEYYITEALLEIERCERVLKNPPLDEDGDMIINLELVQKRLNNWKDLINAIETSESLKEVKAKIPKFNIRNFIRFTDPQKIEELKVSLEKWKIWKDEEYKKGKMYTIFKEKYGIDFSQNNEEWIQIQFEQIDDYAKRVWESNKTIIESLRKSDPVKTNEESKDQKKKEVEKLKLAIKEREKEVRIIEGNALLRNYSQQEIDEMTQGRKNEIISLESLINEYSEIDEMEKYLGRLPEVLSKTFELALSADQKGNIKDSREDILQLLEISTFELTLDTKKELTVKLFDALEGILYPNGGRYRIRTYDPLRVKQVL